MGFVWLRLFCLVWFFFETKQRETHNGGVGGLTENLKADEKG